MNEWLKKFIASFKERWAKWSIVQKAVGIVIIVALIAAIVVTARVSASPSMVPLFNTAINDENARREIELYLDSQNVEYRTNERNIITVPDRDTARRMRTALQLEGLVPDTVDPWSFFDQQSVTTTDFENNIKLRRSVQNQIKQHLESIDDIVHANVVITPRQDSLFSADSTPASASVILTFKPRSMMKEDRKKIKSIQDLLVGIDGLTADNIKISDNEGNTLNDFEGMADFDEIKRTEKQQELRHAEEEQLRKAVLSSLQAILTKDRVRDLNVNIEMDQSKISEQSVTYTPVEITPQDPDKPYDTRVTRDYLPVSSQTITNEWTGTGFNPEGPAGVEGQNPPVYSDMSNVIGKSTQTSVTQNNVMNTTNRQVEVAPSVGRRTVSVNIDGQWIKQYDRNHNPIIEQDEYGSYSIKRTFIPVSDEIYNEAVRLVEGAIGYNKKRGDEVKVTRIPVDRHEEFIQEDEAEIARENRKKTIMLVLIGIVVVLIAFIIFRFISREMERRKRLREEEILRRQQAEREKALWDAKNEGMEVTMSVEERKRAELQENAIAMAKEHPEDVAMLIRTWLMEE